MQLQKTEETSAETAMVIRRKCKMKCFKRHQLEKTKKTNFNNEPSDGLTKSSQLKVGVQRTASAGGGTAVDAGSRAFRSVAFPAGPLHATEAAWQVGIRGQVARVAGVGRRNPRSSVETFVVDVETGSVVRVARHAAPFEGLGRFPLAEAAVSVAVRVRGLAFVREDVAVERRSDGLSSKIPPLSGQFGEGIFRVISSPAFGNEFGKPVSPFRYFGFEMSSHVRRIGRVLQL